MASTENWSIMDFSDALYEQNDDALKIARVHRYITAFDGLDAKIPATSILRQSPHMFAAEIARREDLDR